MSTQPPLDRRTAAAALFVSTAALAVLGVALVPWDWVPGGTLVPAAAGDLLTSAEIARAEDYSAQVRTLSYASLGVSLLLATGLGLSPLGSRLLSRIADRLPWWAAVPVGTALLLLLGRLVTLPLAARVREARLRFGLTEQALGGWLRDRALSLLVTWLATTLVVLLVVGLARRSPRRWFVPAGAATAALVVAGSFVYPLAVEPLFNRFTPLPAGELRTSLLRLAAAEGVDLDEVLVADASRRTTSLNAYVSGIGATRRLVVYDTLVEGSPPAQTRAVVAHELAHAKHHDVVVGTALAAVGSVGGVALLALLLSSRRLRLLARVDGPGDPRAVALLLALLAVGNLAASPARTAVSRAIEVRADRTALAATQDPAGFLGLQRALATRSLADPTPPWWSQRLFGTHPTLPQRAGLPASLEAAQH